MKQQKNEYNYASLFKPLRRKKTLLFFICSLQIAVSLLIPYLLSGLIDTVSMQKQDSSFQGKCILLFALVLVNFLVNLWQNYNWHNYGWSAILLMQRECFRKLLKKPLSYFDQTNLGDTLNKFLNDSATFAQNEAILTLMLFLNLFNIIGVLIFMFLLNVKLSVAVLILLVLYFLFYNKLNQSLRKTGREEREAYSTVMQNAQEELQGIETIHYYGCQIFFTGRFSKAQGGYYERMKKLNFFNAVGISANSAFQNVMLLATIVFGCVLILNHQMNVGALVAFYAYVSYFAEPVKNLADFNLERQKALAVKERVLQLLQDDESGDGGEKQAVGTVKTVCFQDVTFGYGKSAPVLEHFSSEIQAGDRVAVVGQSGTGKSTLLKLLLGQVEPAEGRITVNGIPIESVKSLNDKIAYLGQSPFLFDGTILENIAFSKSPSAENLEEALSISATDLFCSKSEVSKQSAEPGGRNFSGGEKQRIALARTILKNSDIILLDEATSALDLQIEKQVVSNLDRYLNRHPEKILIAVTHRPEIRRICNKVVRMERIMPEADGKAAEQISPAAN